MGLVWTREKSKKQWEIKALFKEKINIYFSEPILLNFYILYEYVKRNETLISVCLFHFNGKKGINKYYESKLFIESFKHFCPHLYEAKRMVMCLELIMQYLFSVAFIPKLLSAFFPQIGDSQSTGNKLFPIKFRVSIYWGRYFYCLINSLWRLQDCFLHVKTSSFLYVKMYFISVLKNYWN